jgi:hypothetical protein|tara:strand:+ start:231 stop:794 length:564 start_codon:yes stop_codon:yes gene_type:complete
MQFRIIELTETDKFQFLRIYKNGNSSVSKCIEDNFPGKFWQGRSLAVNKPRFAVIRDPYERFISGLKYDLKRHNVNVQDIKLDKLFATNEIHLRNTVNGNINHSASQILFLMNAGVSHYIDIKDLNLFLKMHFNNVPTLNKSNQETEEIEKYLDKKEIMKYLHLDYCVYNSIISSPFLWEWQHGKIF